jgi:8-oxo-dGTP diphosphatase
MGQNDQGVETGKKRYQVIPRVLIFLRNDTDVLLLKGAPNKRIWANLYNGVGGHIELGEDIYKAAIREVAEETGLQVSDLRLKAVVNIDAGKPDLGIMMFVFVGWTSERKMISSEEGELHWLPIDGLPEEQLVEDLSWLLPRVLVSDTDSEPMYLHYSYDQEDQLVIVSSAERRID